MSKVAEEKGTSTANYALQIIDKDTAVTLFALGFCCAFFFSFLFKFISIGVS